MLAAAAALSLVGYHKQFFGNAAAARGWLAQGARIIETEAPQLRGELLGARSFVTDDPVECERLAREAWDIGRANGNVDLEVLAMTAIGARSCSKAVPPRAWRCWTRQWPWRSAGDAAIR